MLSVIIVDDEPGICELITKLIKWEELDLQLSGSASCGQDALELIRAKKPDIVITDIRMPGMSGLDLINKAKEINSDVMFVVISGYREFEYAQNALKYGAEDYLLKPIKQDELNSLLKKLAARRVNSILQEENVKQLDSLLLNSKEIIRKNFLFHLLYDENQTKYSTDSDDFKYFDFKSGKYAVLALKIDCSDHNANNTSVSVTILEKAADKINAELKSICHDAEFFCSDNTAVFVINYDEAVSLTEAKKSIKAILQNYMYKYSSHELTVAIGTECISLDGLSLSYKSAKTAVNNRISLGTGIVIEYDSLPAQCRDNDSLMAPEIKEKLRQTILSMNIDNIVSHIDQLFISLFYGRRAIHYRSYLFAEEILLTISSILSETGLYDASGIIDMVSTLNSCSKFEDVHKYLLSSVGSIVQTHLENKKRRDIKPILLAKQYIDENYSETITLETIAKIVHLNPVYLGSLFKTETGMSFSDYLIKARINSAKDLLKNSNYSINEISRIVGYTDAKYFSKLFSKITGVKPTEYRKFYS